MPASTTLLAARRQLVDAGTRRHDAVSASRALLEAVISRRTLIATRIGPGRQVDLLWAGNDPDAIP
jgi:hypothetical protein